MGDGERALGAAQLILYYSINPRLRATGKTQAPASAEKQPLKREKEAKKQKTSKKIKFHPLHCCRNCAILQKLEYARSHGRLHGREIACDHGSGTAPSSLTKRGFRCAGSWALLCYLYADIANFKRPLAQESTFYWRCNLKARIAGVDLPREKRVEIGLTYIYGIGVASSKEILAATEINPDTRVKDLTENEVSKLRDYIEHHVKVEGDLRREVSMNIKRLVEIGCYRGVRHRRSLPVRGQNTKNKYQHG